MEACGIGKREEKGWEGERERGKERKRKRRERERRWIDESRRVWKSVDRWKGGIGGGPTALVAVERTNFVLIEKSPAPNPIYKPANMAGAGRSLARSLARLASPRLTPRRLASLHLVLPHLPPESRYTTAPGFESARAPRILDKGFSRRESARASAMTATRERGRRRSETRPTTAAPSFHT